MKLVGPIRHQFLFEAGDRILGIPGEFRIVQCTECGLIFVNPQPGPEVLKEYYPKDYYAPDAPHITENIPG